MKCTGCIHYEEGCTLKACAYTRISESDLHQHGLHIKNNVWYYNEKNYKIIDFEISTNEFICIEAKET